MPGIIGKKIGMTSIFDVNGKNVACTLIEAKPCVVTQVKDEQTDGYRAVQLSYDDKKEKNTPKTQQGHFKKAGTSPKYKVVELRNFRVEFNEKVKLGNEIKIQDVFQEQDFVDIVGVSKGKGFQGVVKRHGFGGVGQSTHGQHNRSRAPGSIGACSFPSRVFKGLKMAGQTGNHRVKILNLKVMKIYPENNLLLVCGAVPGAKNSYLVLQK